MHPNNLQTPNCYYLLFEKQARMFIFQIFISIYYYKKEKNQSKFLRVLKSQLSKRFIIILVNKFLLYCRSCSQKQKIYHISFSFSKLLLYTNN